MADVDGGKHLSVHLAYAFGAENGLQAEVDTIRNMDIEWDRSYTTSLRRGLLLDLFERHHLLEKFLAACWPNSNSREGQRFLRRYKKIKQQYDEFLATGTEPISPSEDGEPQEGQLFALEAHLRDFLGKNLDLVEPGLTLYEADGQDGREFPVDDGSIDILARSKNGTFVVMEFKLSKGRSRALGQLLYYMGWVDEHLANGPCRGVIIAREIDQALRTGCRRVPGVSLFRFEGWRVSRGRAERRDYMITTGSGGSGTRAGGYGFKNLLQARRATTLLPEHPARGRSRTTCS
jgi:Endonuclease NucS